MHLALFVANRNVFARLENMRAEAITTFVIGIRGLVVVEHPASVLRSARPVDEEAVFIRLAFPKSSYAAMIAMLLPELGIDMTFIVERSYEFIPMSRRALGGTPLSERD